MNHHNAKGTLAVLGIDSAKQSLQLHGVDKDGQVVLKKKLGRKQLSAFIAASLFDRTSGLWRCPSLGEGIDGNGAYGAHDGATIRQTLC